VQIDELVARDQSPTEAEAEEIRRLVETFMNASDDVNAFGSRYIALLASEPRVAMNHGELRAALGALAEPPAA